MQRGNTMEIRSDRNETKYVRYLRYIFHILQQLSDLSIIAIPGETCTGRNDRQRDITRYFIYIRGQTKFTDTILSIYRHNFITLINKMIHTFNYSLLQLDYTHTVIKRTQHLSN